MSSSLSGWQCVCRLGTVSPEHRLWIQRRRSCEQHAPCPSTGLSSSLAWHEGRPQDAGGLFQTGSMACDRQTAMEMEGRSHEAKTGMACTAHIVPPVEWMEQHSGSAGAQAALLENGATVAWTYAKRGKDLLSVMWCRWDHAGSRVPTPCTPKM